MSFSLLYNFYGTKIINHSMRLLKIFLSFIMLKLFSDKNRKVVSLAIDCFLWEQSIHLRSYYTIVKVDLGSLNILTKHCLSYK